MDAFALLKADHKKVARLFEKLEDTTERAAKARQDLFETLNGELAAHMHVEEEILYPVMKERKVTRPLGFEGVEEHRVFKELLAELGSLPVDTEEWTAKLKVLRENVEHHVKEEETESFPKTAKAFSKEELEDLGMVLEEEKLRFSADPLHMVSDA